METLLPLLLSGLGDDPPLWITVDTWNLGPSIAGSGQIGADRVAWGGGVPPYTVQLLAGSTSYYSAQYSTASGGNVPLYATAASSMNGAYATFQVQDSVGSIASVVSSTLVTIYFFDYIDAMADPSTGGKYTTTDGNPHPFWMTCIASSNPNPSDSQYLWYVKAPGQTAFSYHASGRTVVSPTINPGESYDFYVSATNVARTASSNIITFSAS